MIKFIFPLEYYDGTLVWVCVPYVLEEVGQARYELDGVMTSGLVSGFIDQGIGGSGWCRRLAEQPRLEVGLINRGNIEYFQARPEDVNGVLIDEDDGETMSCTFEELKSVEVGSYWLSDGDMGSFVHFMVDFYP